MTDEEYDAALSARSGDPETYLSWSDDGITLMCERQECRTGPLVPVTPGSLAGIPRWWFQTELPYKLTPEMAAAARDAHIATHTEET